MFKIRGLTVVKYFLSAALSVSLFAAIQGQAANSFPTMTQLELIQWLVQLSGDSGSLPPNAKANDYVKWATTQGVTPAGGWQPTAVLTRDVLAQTLAQFFNLNVKAGSDVIKALQREGIDLPGSSDGSTITRKDWVNLVDVNGLGPRSGKKNDKLTKHRTPPKKDTPPRHDNGNNNNNNNGLDGPGKRTRPDNH